MPKIYAVKQGRKPGIYQTWDETKAQVLGFPKAQHKSFSVMSDAIQYLEGEGKSLEAAYTTDLPIVTNSIQPIPENENGEVLNIYTDGCCINNGRGGAIAGAGVFFSLGDPRNISERVPGEQTNNRGELLAAIRALEVSSYNVALTIHTDSMYLINGLKGWIANWKKRGWKTSYNTPVLNKDLWERLDELNSSRKSVEWVYVKAHSGILGNEEADRLAKIGAYLPAVKSCN
ncbi:Ribonuclease H1 [Lobulomyces angularis]|nr:Ribonuclease H1 [Lobulomyces angularis]